MPNRWQFEALRWRICFRWRTGGNRKRGRWTILKVFDSSFENDISLTARRLLIACIV